ncbi:hypothetical protein MBLNU457_6379t1 [Dothideomycetes sp. NU457]
MTENEDLKGYEAAQATAALGGGGVVEESHDEMTASSSGKVVKVDSEEKSESDHISQPGSHEEREPHQEHEEVEDSNDQLQDAPQDLEAMTRTISQAPHSIFSMKQKRFIVAMAAWGGFFSAVSGNIYFPALNTLSADFHVSATLINLTLTTYTIFQGLAPTFVGDLADMAGRRPAYIFCFVVYIGANIGLALCKNYASLLILRCLQSTGSSGTIALGSGVVADIATSAERGIWMGWNTAGPMIAPAVGPVIGGILAQFLGWRSIFWFLVILSALYLSILLLFFPETGRNVVGNGSIPPQSWNVSLISHLSTKKAAKEEAARRPNLERTISQTSQQRQAQTELANRRKLRWPNPLHTLKIVAEKDVAMLLFFNSLVYIAFYDLLASNPYLFAQVYGFNDLQIGLCFIPYGVGAIVAPLVNGRMLDWNFRRLAKKKNLSIDKKRGNDLRDFPIEQSRIQITLPLVALGVVAYLCYGWVMEVNAPLAAPLVLQFIIGLCITGSFNTLNVLLVDLYPLSPSTATAANNLVRCLMGAWGAAAIIPMIEGMGRGWTFTLIALVVAVFSPILLVLQKYGPKWREERRVKAEHMKEEKALKEKEKVEREERENEHDNDHREKHPAGATLNRQLSHHG